MYQTISEQFIILLKFILVGVLFGVFYDGFKVIRGFYILPYQPKFIEKMKNKAYLKVNNPVLKQENKKIRAIKLFIFDLLYFVFISPICAIFLYSFNNGKMRWYIFLGLFIGFLVYNRTLGRITSYVLQYLIYYHNLLKSFILFYLNKVFKAVAIKIKSKVKVIPKRIKNNNENKREVLIKYGK
ncbi:MAG: spore cortex biosynthesis protein YabQ [Clostridia bacterium]|nr:spore cortex biosynthesis protein YabQ [Clostridia bacterium]